MPDVSRGGVSKGWLLWNHPGRNIFVAEDDGKTRLTLDHTCPVGRHSPGLAQPHFQCKQWSDMREEGL